jgi:hypothetical protein
MNQPRCTGQTKHGAACKSWALPGKALCIQHDPTMAATREAARRRGGTAAARLRAIEGKRLKLDTARALVKFVSATVQDCLSGSVEPDVARVALYGCSIQMRLLEQSDLEKRLAALETAVQQERKPTWAVRR